MPAVVPGPGPFYIRRTNAVGNVWFLRPNGEWAIQWQGGVGGYKLQTWKTPTGARRIAAQLSVSFRGHSISVMTDDPSTRPVETFFMPMLPTMSPTNSR
jgi:hypothetical protein